MKSTMSAEFMKLGVTELLKDPHNLQYFFLLLLVILFSLIFHLFIPLFTYLTLLIRIIRHNEWDTPPNSRLAQDQNQACFLG